MPVIGWLTPVPGAMERRFPAFTRGLAETGYVVGRNATIVSREGDEPAALAADLVRQHVTVLAVVGLTGVQAAKEATQNIPVVFLMAPDPVETGVVSAGGRPDCNFEASGRFRTCSG
jgi:putative tryptophan/tyrosine transport system substrate-binding protein